MTISTTTTFNLTGSQLVNAALRKLSVLGDGNSPTSTQLANGMEALNVMLKAFTSKGMPLWVITQYDVPMTATADYPMGIGQTINIPAPLKVLQAVLKNNTARTTIPMNIRTHYDFNLLSNLNSLGTPNTFWYEPLNQTGVLHIWPTPDIYNQTNCVVSITYQRPFYDVADPADTLDFPQWWFDAIIYGLAWRLSPEYGTPLADRKELMAEATYFLEEALSFGEEEGSISFEPDWVTQ